MAITQSMRKQLIILLSIIKKDYPFHSVTRKGMAELVQACRYRRLANRNKYIAQFVHTRKYCVKKHYYVNNLDNGIIMHFQDGQSVSIIRKYEGKRVLGQMVGEFFFKKLKDAKAFVIYNRKLLENRNDHIHP